MSKHLARKLELRAGNRHLEPMRGVWLGALGLVAISAAEAGGQSPEAADVSEVLERVGERVEAFYARARTLTSTETLRWQNLERDLRPIGFARVLVYDVRIAWEADANGIPGEPSVFRQLLTVNGRAPRPKDKPVCTDPGEVSPDSLALLLPHNRPDYHFTAAGRAREDGRDALMIDFRPIVKETPRIEWKDECVLVDAPSWTRGRIWVDAERADVLRLDEHLAGMIDFPTTREAQRRGAATTIALERHDSSIRYREVQFEDPVERLTLPKVVDTTTVWRNTGSPRVRITQEFSGYRRFITGSRIIDGDNIR
jgi:hypothetical protein